MSYLDQIDQEYGELEASYRSTKRNGTSAKDVLQFLVDNKSRIWWWSWEFVGKHTSKGGYLSHRAPARASDLALHIPELVEDRRIGRFKVYRVRLENIKAVSDYLKDEYHD